MTIFNFDKLVVSYEDMKISIKSKIIDFLKGRDWVFGGEIEDYIRTFGHKASNASRRCRELYNSGILEKRLVKVKSFRVIQYKLKKLKPQSLF